MACHDGFATLEEMADSMPLGKASIQDLTWEYVIDIHDPDDIWYTTL
jgi:hypothetical protein